MHDVFFGIGKPFVGAPSGANAGRENPLVSVVIPAYNAAWCVEKAVDSALGQDYRPLEIVVVNDGSTDETAAVLRRYGDSIRIVSKPNGGLSSARNAGIEAAGGECIAFLDADDWWLPGKIAAQVELMQDCPQIGFCSVATRAEDPEGNLLRLWECPDWQDSFLEALFHQNAAVPGSGSGVMVRKVLFDQAGLFDESLDSLEDIDMWMRLAAITEYACIREPLTVILKRPGSMSRNLEVMRTAALRVMRKNRALLPAHRRGAYWRVGLAGVLTDYAKWQYRVGRRSAALADTARAFMLAPFERGRLCLGLIRDILLGRPV